MYMEWYFSLNHDATLYFSEISRPVEIIAVRIYKDVTIHIPYLCVVTNTKHMCNTFRIIPYNEFF